MAFVSFFEDASGRRRFGTGQVKEERPAQSTTLATALGGVDLRAVLMGHHPLFDILMVDDGLVAFLPTAVDLVVFGAVLGGQLVLFTEAEEAVLAGGPNQEVVVVGPIEVA